MSWVKKIYTLKWQNLLKQITRKKFGTFPESDSHFEEALQSLYEKLHKYDENNVSDALIVKVFKDALVSHHRSLYGYPRPKAWLLRKGKLGKTVFKYFCNENLPKDAVLSRLTQEFKLEDLPSRSTEESLDLASAIIDEIIRRNDCSVGRGNTVSIDDDVNGAELSHLTDESLEPSDELAGSEMEVIVRLLTSNDQSFINELPERLRLLKLKVNEDLQLSDRDRLILSLYYLEEMSEKKAASAIKLSHAIFRRRRIVLEAMISDWLSDNT